MQQRLKAEQKQRSGTRRAPSRPAKTDRQQRIVSELKVNTALRVSDLANRFGVTTETIRRDLDFLAERGLIARTYGGAASAPSGELSFNERYRQQVAERRRVAECAASLVEPGEVLMIDAGSTTTHFARRLAADAGELTVITNSVGVATALGSTPEVRVVLCPGDYNSHEGGVFGAETRAFLQRFHADKCFIGASGLTAEGPSDASTDAAWVKRVMIERSARSFLLIDASKFGVIAVDRVCSLHDVDELICDARPAPRVAKIFERHGVCVHIAPARTASRRVSG